MGKLIVKASGFYTSIQDQGRFGYRQCGVPVSGAMDQTSAAMANLLVNNPPSSPIIEVTMTGPTIEFDSPTQIAIAGAQLSPSLDGVTLPNNKKHLVKSGQILAFGKLEKGFRAYLAVKGLKAEEMLKSQSQYEGITSKKRIEPGDIFEYETCLAFAKDYAAIHQREELIENDQMEVFPGPEFENFKKKDLEYLISKPLLILENDRMGYQLSPQEPSSHELSITSSNVVPGTVQLTPSGRLLVLMRDAQVTGGYPRPFQLTNRSIDLLAQKKTGDRVFIKLI